MPLQACLLVDKAVQRDGSVHDGVAATAATIAFYPLPLVVDRPAKVLDSSLVTLADMDRAELLFSADLPPACKVLYENVAGKCDGTLRCARTCWCQPLLTAAPSLAEPASACWHAMPGARAAGPRHLPPSPSIPLRLPCHLHAFSLCSSLVAASSGQLCWPVGLQEAQPAGCVP